MKKRPKVPKPLDWMYNTEWEYEAFVDEDALLSLIPPFERRRYFSPNKQGVGNKRGHIGPGLGYSGNLSRKLTVAMDHSLDCTYL
jgi:hypothetical protein